VDDVFAGRGGTLDWPIRGISLILLSLEKDTLDLFSDGRSDFARFGSALAFVVFASFFLGALFLGALFFLVLFKNPLDHPPLCKRFELLIFARFDFPSSSSNRSSSSRHEHSAS